MILTIDLGTTATKVALWARDGLVAMGRSTIETRHGPGGRVEQDPSSWWASVVSAFHQVRDATGQGDIECIGTSAARQTFVPVDGDGVPIGMALLWSDRRAAAEAADITASCGGSEAVRRVPGIALGAGSVLAKIAWLARNEPERIEDARWLLSPRDLVVLRMTGVATTDTTLASATGLYEWDGRIAGELVDAARLDPERLSRLLPEVTGPSNVVGTLAGDVAAELGIGSGVPVVIGAGDRACEVLGTGASASRPMVSWGTTANVSLPLSHIVGRAPSRPEGTVVTRAADDGWLIEGGLSAAGALLDWLGRVTHVEAAELARVARSSPPGARGLLLMPWLGGARAPWWRDDADVSILGVQADHDAADLARAAIEGVAFDVARCLDAMSAVCAEEASGAPPWPTALSLAGGGSGMPVWVDVVSAVTGVPCSRRRSGESASAGAALVASHAVGIEVELDSMDPVVEEAVPDPTVAEHYKEVRRLSDEAAANLLGPGRRDATAASGTSKR